MDANANLRFLHDGTGGTLALVLQANSLPVTSDYASSLYHTVLRFSDAPRLEITVAAKKRAVAQRGVSDGLFAFTAEGTLRLVDDLTGDAPSHPSS